MGKQSTIRVVVQLMLLAFAAWAISSVPSAAEDSAYENSAAEDLLQDALDAIDERQLTEARSHLEELITQYPDAPQAARARREMSRLRGESMAQLPSRYAPNAPASMRLVALRNNFVTTVGDRVFFAENSAAVGGRARTMIENQARWLKKQPSLRITVIGRSDDGGSPRSATDLSRRRAEAVRDRLIVSGIDAGRIMIDARGDQDKLALCKTFMCQAQNRVAETLISEQSLGFDPVAREGDILDAADHRATAERSDPARSTAQ